MDAEGFRRLYEDGWQWDRSPLRSETVAMVLKVAGPLNRRTVLDAGCGSGGLAVALAGLGAEVSAFDVVEDQVKRNVASWPRVRWSVGDLADDASWPIAEDGGFDLVVANESLQYVPPAGLARTVHQLWSLVKLEGRMIVTMPNIASPAGRVDLDGPSRPVGLDARWIGSFASQLPGVGRVLVRGLHLGIDQQFEAYDLNLVDELSMPPPFHVLCCFVRD